METRARVAAAVLWTLIVAAALGGVIALFGQVPSPTTPEQSPAPQALAEDVVAVAGFAERTMAAYLAANPGSVADLAAVVDVPPDPPSTPPLVAAGGTVRATGVEAIGQGYWAVTVAAGEAGREAFWRIGVARTGQGRLVPTGLPTPMAAPSGGTQPDPAVAASDVPAPGDPVVETVTGWVAAYACGQGDATRYLAPGVEVEPVRPPACAQARLDRWGGSEPDSEGRITVVTEAVLAEGGGAERRVAFALVLARRGGRWEIAELLGGPPLARSSDRRHEEEGVVG